MGENMCHLFVKESKSYNIFSKCCLFIVSYVIHILHNQELKLTINFKLLNLGNIEHTN